MKLTNMDQPDNLGSFIKDSKPLLKEYLETRLELFRLQAIRTGSRSAGYLVWVIVAVFLLFLVLLFAGIVLGCWLSLLTGSYVTGFGLTTIVFLLIFGFFTAFRDKLFIHPVMHSIIRKTVDQEKPTE